MTKANPCTAFVFARERKPARTRDTDGPASPTRDSDLGRMGAGDRDVDSSRRPWVENEEEIGIEKRITSFLSRVQRMGIYEAAYALGWGN